MICCSALVQGLGGDAAPEPHGGRNRGPVVVWNVTQRCNLSCAHCYGAGDENGSPGSSELTSAEGRELIRDVASMGSPVMLFSGGEPLLRPDLLQLLELAASLGLRTALSTNGTLISLATARLQAGAHVSYVGISLDGGEAVHDHFRGKRGAYGAALAGLRNCRAAGLKSGIRFTLTRSNLPELPAVLDLVEQEGISRFCLYHLVYAGRGRELIDQEPSHAETRAALALLLAHILDWRRHGVEVEVLTTDNHADGPFIAGALAESCPERAEELRRMLGLQCGCSAGKRIASIDPFGNFRPCQFWRSAVIGSVREKPFSALWGEERHPVLARLRRMPGPLAGRRCGRCVHSNICGGCRVRAEAAGDPWGDDPACYLSDAEIGLPEEVLA